MSKAEQLPQRKGSLSMSRPCCRSHLTTKSASHGILAKDLNDCQWRMVFGSTIIKNAFVVESDSSWRSGCEGVLARKSFPSHLNTIRRVYCLKRWKASQYLIFGLF
jgi:hypothetical protein